MEYQNQNYQELVSQPFQSIEPSQPYQIIEPINYIDSQIEAEIKWQKFQQMEEMRKAMLPRYYTQEKVEKVELQPIVQVDNSPSFAFKVGETIKQILKILLILIILAVITYINIVFWFY